MLKDLLGFLNGTIIKENSTCSKIILSNGNKYDAKLFHQSLGIVRLLTNKEINSPEQQLFQEYIKEEQEKIINNKLSGLAKISSMTNIEILCSQPIFISFGKYRGHYSCDVKDVKYFNWMLNTMSLEEIAGGSKTILN